MVGSSREMRDPTPQYDAWILQIWCFPCVVYKTENQVGGLDFCLRIVSVHLVSF